jgi:hypothetical protein
VSEGTVIGCVWGAHRRLVDAMGDDAPTYGWCEQEWVRLRRTAPGPAALPAWLEQELWCAWRRHLVATGVIVPALRPPGGPVQLALALDG